MNPGHEIVLPTTGDSTPLPRKVVEVGSGAVALGPAAVLHWIAASGTEPWFPSAHARDHAVPRDSLDEPLNELRNAELIRVAAWVKGAGQGYALTAEGEAAAKDPAFAERFRSRESQRLTVAPAEQPTKEIELLPATVQSTTIEFRPPVVTPIIVAANLLWFAVCVAYALWQRVPIGPFLSKGDSVILHQFGAVFGPDLLAGQWWRLMSSCFVHFGIFHLIMNMLALGAMGPLAELLWGRWRFLVIYLVAGLGGSCLAMALHPVDPETGALVLLAGASGAICGVLIALLTWLMLYRDFLPPHVGADLLRRLMWAVVLTVGVSVVPDVSWQGHLGGAVAGFVTAVLLNAHRFGDRRQKWMALVGLLCVPVVCIGGLVAAMDSGDRWIKLQARYVSEVVVAKTPTDSEAKIAAALAAQEEFNAKVAPLLNKLSPDAVQGLELEAGIVLARPIHKKPELGTVDAVRKKVERLRGIAADVVAKLASPPTGVDEIDKHRAKALAFAAARVKSFDLLLGLLAANAPDAKAEEAWHIARAEANRLWGEFAKK